MSAAELKRNVFRRLLDPMLVSSNTSTVIDWMDGGIETMMRGVYGLYEAF